MQKRDQLQGHNLFVQSLFRYKVTQLPSPCTSFPQVPVLIYADPPPLVRSFRLLLLLGLGNMLCMQTSIKLEGIYNVPNMKIQ